MYDNNMLLLTVMINVQLKTKTFTVRGKKSHLILYYQ